MKYEESAAKKTIFIFISVNNSGTKFHLYKE